MSSTGTTRHPVGNLIPQPDYRTIDGPEIGTVQPFRNKTRNSEEKKQADINLRALDSNHRHFS